MKRERVAQVIHERKLVDDARIVTVLADHVLLQRRPASRLIRHCVKVSGLCGRRFLIVRKVAHE